VEGKKIPPMSIKKLVLFLFAMTFVTVSTYAQERTPLPPVGNFKLSDYLGKWYEIARITKSFEKNCACVTAEYDLRDDGDIDVKNTCVNSKNGKTKVAHGRARFATENETVGDLKVSFFLKFLPFTYANYRIVELSADGSVSVVSNKRGTTLWVLSRDPDLSRAAAEAYIERASPNLRKNYSIEFDIQDGCDPI
jgi:apolipoprotein D and lipocalin family protein